MHLNKATIEILKKIEAVEAEIARRCKNQESGKIIINNNQTIKEERNNA